MLKNKWLQAGLSGLMLGFSWPYTGSITPLIFIALIPLLYVEDELYKKGKYAMWSFYPYAYLTFFIFNVITTYWIYNVDEPFGVKLFSAGSAIVLNAAFMAFFLALFHFTRSYVGSKEGYISLILYWLAWEYLHLDWDLSWPWLTFGNVFSIRTSWIQWYDLTGVLGGSLWILVTNLLLFFAVKGHIEGLSYRRNRNLLAIAMIFLFVFGMSWMRSSQEFSEEKGLNVVLVQPNIDPYKEKFDLQSSDAKLARMLEIAEEKITAETDILLFPETALQERSHLFYKEDSLVSIGLWENNIEQSNSLRALRVFLERYPHVSLLFGMSSDRVQDPDEEIRVSSRYIPSYDLYYESYNAALLLEKDREAEFYHKSELVPAVEFMPFQSILQHIASVAIDMGGTSGTLGTQEDQTPFVTSNGLAISPAICYESIYGRVNNEFVRNGAQVLGIITNDGWWGDSPGYKQHMSYASLRAIECRKYVARSANTGISCFIDPYGKVIQESDWWVETVLADTIYPNDHLTFYSQYDDYLGSTSAFLMLLLLLYTFVRKIKAKDELKNVAPRT